MTLKMETEEAIQNKLNQNSVTESTELKVYAPPGSIPKLAAEKMQRIYSKHSQLIDGIKDLKPLPLPEDYSYVEKSSIKLAERDQTMARNSQLKSPPKYLWKEIQIFSQPIKSNAASANCTSMESKKACDEIQITSHVTGTTSDNPSPTESNGIPKEIQTTDRITEKNTASNNCTSLKNNGASKVADDSGFSEAIPDVPSASSSVKKRNAKIKNTPKADKEGQSSSSTSSRKRSRPKNSSPKDDSVETCPICGDKFPMSLIQDHASECGHEEIYVVTPTQESKRPERLAKSKAKKRIFREQECKLQNNLSTSQKIVLENEETVDGEVAVLDIEKSDDDVILVDNGISSSSQKKKRSSQVRKVNI